MYARHRRIIEALPIFSVVFLVWTAANAFSERVTTQADVIVHHWVVNFPRLITGLCLSVTPILLAIKSRRRFKEFATGLCPRCEYDLRATPERCPECGLQFPKEHVRSSSTNNESTELV